MSEMKLGAVEHRFAEIVWKNAPLSSGELAKLCLKELSWKRTTTYTVLKKLCDKGIFQNEGSVVTVLISEEEFSSIQSEQFVQETFGGSLPAFIAAFTSGKKLTDSEADEIRRMIDNAREGS